MAWGASAPAATVNTNIAATSFATASWTPTANRLLVVYVGFSIAAGTAVAPTLSGNGLTWTFVRQGIGANPDGLAIYVALSTAAPSTGALTIDFAGVSQTYCIAQVIEIDGADISGTALAAIIQNDGTSPAAQASPFSRSFASVPQVSSRVMAGYYLTLNTAMTPRANWTELFDAGNAAAPARELEIQWRSDVSEQTYSVSGWAGSVQFRAGAIEIKALTAPLGNSSAHRVKQLRPVPGSVGRRAKAAIIPHGSPMVRQAVQERRHRIAPLRRVSGSVPPAPTGLAGRPLSRRRFLAPRRPRLMFRVPPSASSAPTTACSLTLVNGTSYLLLSNGVDHLSLAVCGNPAFIASLLRRRLGRPPSVRRARPDLVLTQAAPVNPALTFTQPQRRGLRAALRRGKPVTAVPTQAAPVNPALVFTAPQRRTLRGLLRKSKPVIVVPAQAAAPNPALVFTRPSRRSAGGLKVRRRPIERTPDQIILPNPALAPSRALRRRIIAVIFRRGRRLEVPQGHPAGPTIIYPTSGVIGGSSTRGTVPNSATTGTVPESGTRSTVL